MGCDWGAGYVKNIDVMQKTGGKVHVTKDTFLMRRYVSFDRWPYPHPYFRSPGIGSVEMFQTPRNNTNIAMYLHCNALQSIFA